MQVSNWLLERDEVHWTAQVADTLHQELRKLTLLRDLQLQPAPANSADSCTGMDAGNSTTGVDAGNSTTGMDAGSGTTGMDVESGTTGGDAESSAPTQKASDPAPLSEPGVALLQELPSHCTASDALASPGGVAKSSQTSTLFKSPPSWASGAWSICFSGIILSSFSSVFVLFLRKQL